MKTLADAKLLETVKIWKSEPAGFRKWTVKVVRKSPTKTLVQCSTTALTKWVPNTAQVIG